MSDKKIKDDKSSFNENSGKDENAGNEETDEDHSSTLSESASNYSSTGLSIGGNNHVGKMKFNISLNSLRSATLVGSGATGQVIRLENSNIALKCCDSYNNPDGFAMLKKEVSIYEKLSKFNLNYVPRYYGECEYYGQYFIAMEFIDGKHCDWRRNKELEEKLDLVIRDLKSVGVVHCDLRPENVLLTRDRDIKLIDFGKAEIV